MDLGSSHGTFVDNLKIDSNKPTLITSENIIKFGQSSRNYKLKTFQKRKSLPIRPAVPLFHEDKKEIATSDSLTTSTSTRQSRQDEIAALAAEMSSTVPIYKPSNTFSKARAQDFNELADGATVVYDEGVVNDDHDEEDNNENEDRDDDEEESDDDRNIHIDSESDRIEQSKQTQSLSSHNAMEVFAEQNKIPISHQVRVNCYIILYNTNLIYIYICLID
jgi:hypothetical protein